MSKKFCVPILNSMTHNKITVRVLEPYRKKRKQTEFIREAIMKIAIEKGYEIIPIGIKSPDYIPDKIWTKIKKAQSKSFFVNYNYVIAFLWLLSLPEFADYKKSKLMRKIIIVTHHQQ